MVVLGITLSDTGFYKRIIRKYRKYKSPPFPALIFYKNPRYPYHDIKIGVMVKLHFHIWDKAARNSALNVKDRLEKHILYIKKYDPPNIFLSFDDNVILSHKGVMSLPRVEMSGSAFPSAFPSALLPARWQSAWIVSQYMKKISGTSYELFQAPEFRSIFLSLPSASNALIPHATPDAIRPGGMAMTLYVPGRSGYTHLVGPKTPDIHNGNIRESKRLFNLLWKKGMVAESAHHRVHREHRALPLFSVSSVLSVVSNQRISSYLQNFPDLLSTARKTSSIPGFHIEIERHQKKHHYKFGSEVKLIPPGSFINNKEITREVFQLQAHPKSGNEPGFSGPGYQKEYHSGSRALLSIVRPVINITERAGNSQSQTLNNILSTGWYWETPGYKSTPLIQFHLKHGKTNDAGKEMQNAASWDLSNLKKAAMVDTIDGDMIYLMDQKNIENEVANIKKIIEETKKAIPDLKNSRKNESNIVRINIDQISDRVYQMIDRRIKIEAERRCIL